MGEHLIWNQGSKVTEGGSSAATVYHFLFFSPSRSPLVKKIGKEKHDFFLLSLTKVFTAIRSLGSRGSAVYCE